MRQESCDLQGWRAHTSHLFRKGNQEDEEEVEEANEEFHLLSDVGSMSDQVRVEPFTSDVVYGAAGDIQSDASWELGAIPLGA